MCAHRRRDATTFGGAGISICRRSRSPPLRDGRSAAPATRKGLVFRRWGDGCDSMLLLLFECGLFGMHVAQCPQADLAISMALFVFLAYHSLLLTSRTATN